jgi:hypothetical protein
MGLRWFGGAIAGGMSAVREERNGRIVVSMAFDAAVELSCRRARWYDANAGGFVREAPADFGGGDSNFARCGGNRPTNFTDSAEDRTKNVVNVVDSEKLDVCVYLSNICS